MIVLPGFEVAVQSKKRIGRINQSPKGIELHSIRQDAELNWFIFRAKVMIAKTAEQALRGVTCLASSIENTASADIVAETKSATSLSDMCSSGPCEVFFLEVVPLEYSVAGKGPLLVFARIVRSTSFPMTDCLQHRFMCCDIFVEQQMHRQSFPASMTASFQEKAESKMGSGMVLVHCLDRASLLRSAIVLRQTSLTD